MEAMADGAREGSGAGQADGRTDAAVRLGSGRQLGYSDCGDPRGVPVLVFHATPGSRRLAISSDATAYELGVRVIGVERPGFGLSHYHPRRTVLDWPDYIAELADILGLDAFGVIGVAAGAPYALACGYRIPRRLTGLGIVSGLAPPAMYSDDALVTLVRVDPDQARSLILREVGAFAGDIDAAVAELAERDGSDGAVYSQPDVQRQLAETAREALREGMNGMVTDVWLQNIPWCFNLREVATSVHWWHGSEDELTPLPVVERTLAELPHSELTTIPGGGHAIAFEHGDEILAIVAGWA
jgi:pimeloyl-ACP methyl ester carboxylesterase